MRIAYSGYVCLALLDVACAGTVTNGGNVGGTTGIVTGGSGTTAGGASSHIGGSSSMSMGGTTQLCSIDTDCRLFDDYCGGCNCQALLKTADDPTCAGTTVNCFAAPCMNNVARCSAARCVVGS
jgi:hypothetical protein